MFGSRREKLESKFKQLNALRAEYHSELEEAERRHHRREIGEEDLLRVRRRVHAKLEDIAEKIRRTREELDQLKR
ncbi:MAG: hypothetical protein JXA45_05305 [Methanomassiliicoccales archaeon]|nr:hypothetical protein [Methanomassiliicoccales archaeon]